MSVFIAIVSVFVCHYQARAIVKKKANWYCLWNYSCHAHFIVLSTHQTHQHKMFSSASAEVGTGGYRVECGLHATLTQWMDFDRKNASECASVCVNVVCLTFRFSFFLFILDLWHTPGTHQISIYMGNVNFLLGMANVACVCFGMFSMMRTTNGQTKL